LSRDPSKPEGLAWVESVVEKNLKGAAGKKTTEFQAILYFFFFVRALRKKKEKEKKKWRRRYHCLSLCRNKRRFAS